jgi:hypothetical protein
MPAPATLGSQCQLRPLVVVVGNRVGCITYSKPVAKIMFKPIFWLRGMSRW